MDILYTNDYLHESNILNQKIITQRNCDAVFIEYLTKEKVSLGCVFTLKRRDNFQCKLCRKYCDQRRYQQKKRRLQLSSELGIDESSNDSTHSVVESELQFQSSSFNNDLEVPACCIIDGEQLTWVKKEHVTRCTLLSLGGATAKSYKNLAVIHKSHFPSTSKETYDAYHKYLKSDLGYKVTTSDIVDNFPPFEKIKNTFDKARKYIFQLF